MQEFSGYTVGYKQGEAPFPVYVVGFLGVVLLAAGIATGNRPLLWLGLPAMAFVYYNYPLIEKGRPRLGANEYGIFIDGFGVIGWRAVDRIDIAVIAVRALTINELQIALKQPLGSALIADWRQVPWHRMLMRLPWKMSPNTTIRVALDPLDRDPEEVHRTLVRMWRYYRS